MLRDVAIINENDIWAVGEIYLNDSLGQPDPHAYNAAQWNGTTWEIKRIPFTGSCSAVIYPPIRSIFVFSNDDMWFARGGSLVHYDGNSYFNDCGMNSFLTGSINKIWGSSSNDLYIAGDEGNIAHYNGTSWQKIESGTNLNINDIWGIIDKDGNNFILCSAYNFGSGGEKKLLSISNNNVIGEIPWVENRELYTVWFNTGDKIYAGGEGLFYRTNNEWKEETLPALFKFRVRGEELNDILIAGGFGFAAHYNGSSWKTFEEVSLAAGNYKGLAVKSNTVVLSGNGGSKAVITIGNR